MTAVDFGFEGPPETIPTGSTLTLVNESLPTGADPGEYMEAAAEAEGGPPAVAGGPPHFVHGMFAEVTVEG